MIRILLPVLLAVTTQVAAQSYPSRPVRVVVPLGAGGFADTPARMLAPRLSEQLGKTFFIENRPGAGGTIGADFVAKSAPDGYTLLLTGTPHVTSAHLYKNLPYDIFKDFANVTDVCRSPVMLIVNAGNPAKSVKEFVDWGKGRKLSYAYWGNGSTGHLLGHLFSRQTGLDATHVAYKGGAAAVTDVVGGQVDSIIIDLGSTRAQITSGRLRALGLFLDRRMPQLPELPTMEEAGFKGMSLAGFYGMYAPAGTPREIVARMSAEVQKILKAPDVVQRFYDFAFIPGGSDPDSFTRMVRGEYDRWEPIVKSVGVQLEM